MKNNNDNSNNSGGKTGKKDIGFHIKKNGK